MLDQVRPMLYASAFDLTQIKKRNVSFKDGKQQMTPLEQATCAIYGEANLDGLGDVAGTMKQRVRLAILQLREPSYAVIRAMAESRARDDEGEFDPLMDLIDFSGENKTHTVLAQAWRDAIDAILREV